MRLLSLEVTNYRNIASARLEPGRELTVICGNNGQGKTNLLEAIWLLTGGKSFRGGKDAELVRRGETFAVLEAVTQRTRQEDQEPDDPARVRITVGTPDAPRPGRYASVNGAAPKRAAGLADLLKQRQNEELRAGQSLCGVHREDLELLLDDQPARVFASQGQQRSVVLSLKMAEAAAAARITGEHPVLLLDDVLSELDEGRKQYLLTRMKEKQTFVTSCDDTAFLKTDGEVYRMNGGVLSRA